MTDEQINKFLTLLIGECWHEWNDDGSWNTCKVCELQTREIYPNNPDHLADPLPVIRWMEKEMPMPFSSYLLVMFKGSKGLIEWLDKILDLRNLVDFLWEHQEWGEKECPKCRGYGIDVTGDHNCPTCHGTGKIIHPALKYLREVKG